MKNEEFIKNFKRDFKELLKKYNCIINANQFGCDDNTYHVFNFYFKDVDNNFMIDRSYLTWSDFVDIND